MPDSKHVKATPDMVLRHNRLGVSIDCDEVYFAWTSGDLQRMLNALDLETNAIERWMLLQCLVTALYQERRKNPGVTNLLRGVAETHVDEMPYLLSEMKRDATALREKRGLPAKAFERPGVACFAVLEDLNVSAGDFDGAKYIWRRAVEVGYLTQQEADPILAALELQRTAQRKPPAQS